MIIVSLTNPADDEFEDFSRGRRVLTNNRNIIGDNCEPFGITVLVVICSPLYFPRFIAVVLSSRKDLTTFVIHFGIPFPSCCESAFDVTHYQKLQIRPVYLPGSVVGRSVLPLSQLYLCLRSGYNLPCLLCREIMVVDVLL